MTKTGYLAACAIAALVLLGVDTVGATPSAQPAPHYIQPKADKFVRVAALFGESDEEKAARLQHEADQDNQIKALNTKIDDLEASVRNLTGQNEELGHRVTELNQKIDRQQKDFEYRLCAMMAQQLGSAVGQGDPNAVPCPGGMGASANVLPGAPAPAFSAPMNVAPRSDAGAPRLAPPPGVLGTLPAGAASAGPAANDEQFGAAMNLLAKGRNDDARAAFRAYADANPQADLAPQAVFWIGSIATMQKDYDGATKAYAEILKKYPTWNRAPDSMFKLGQVLVASGQKKEGCTAFAALPAKYPKASKSLLAQGADARKAACHSDA